MKLQLDTVAKTIKLEESVNLNELIEKIQQLLPNDLWKEFKLEPTVFYNWINPIVVQPYKIEPYYPRWPWISTADPFPYNQPPTTIIYSLNNGTYNIEV